MEDCDDSKDVAATDDLLGPELRRRVLQVFGEHHLGMELCGCIDMDKFQSDGWLQRSVNHQALLHAITVLSAPYLGDDEVARMDGRQNNRGFATSNSLLRHCLTKARATSRQTSDQPQVISIQINLCLALRELLAASSSLAWLYCGLAIRQAQALRMRMEYNQRHDPRQQEIRRRTFWACMVMDRLVALCTFRTQTIDPGLVTIHLPASDVAFAFGHSAPSPRWDELGARAGDRSSPSTTNSLYSDQPLNLRPYWIKTVILWGYIASDYVDYGRRNVAVPPMEGPYSSHSLAMAEWHAALPAEMRWNESNLRAHRSLSQAALFAEMHFLIIHASFVVLHEYLPQIAESPAPTSHRPSGGSLLLPGHDRAGIAFTRVDELLINACVDGASQVVNMARVVMANNVPCSIGMGVAMVTASSVLLWFMHCSKQTAPSTAFDHIDHAQAEQNITFLLSVLDTAFPQHWHLAQVWASSVRLLDRFYLAQYMSTTQPDATADSGGETGNACAADTHEDDGGGPRPTQLQVGDGLPDISMIPDGLYYKARLITGLSMEMPDLLYRNFLRRHRQLPAETRAQTRDWAYQSEKTTNAVDSPIPGASGQTPSDLLTTKFWEFDPDLSFLTSLDTDIDPATWATFHDDVF